MLKMVDGTGIIGVDMICPLGVSTPQPPNYDKVELEGTGMLVLPNSLDAPLERLELGGKTEQVQTTGAQLITLANRTDVGDTELGGKKWLTKISEQAYSVYNNYQKSTVEFMGNNSFKLSHNTGASSTNGNGLELPVKIKPDTDYTLSYTSSISEVLVYFIQMDSGCNKLKETSMRNKKHTFHSEANAEWVILKFASVLNNSYVVSNIQFEKGTVATSFEPYTGGKPSPSPEYPQEIKNSGKWNEGTQKYKVDVKITNAEQNWSKEQVLTLTSDRPITKWDRLVEQGGEIGWLYKSKTATITGKEHYSAPSESYYSGTSTNMYTVDFGLFIKGGEYCNRLQRIDGIWDSSNINNIGFTTNGSNQIHIRIYNSLLNVSDNATKEEKVAAFKTYLMKEYENGNPYIVIFQTKDTEFIPLPQSEQNAIRALKTYYPTTVITADGGEVDPDIKVTYRKEI